MFTGIRNTPISALGMLKMASKCHWARVRKIVTFLPILCDVHSPCPWIVTVADDAVFGTSVVDDIANTASLLHLPQLLSRRCRYHFSDIRPFSPYYGQPCRQCS